MRFHPLSFILPLLVLFLPLSARADKAFRDQFQAKYVKAASTDPKDAALREASEKAGCQICHVGDDRKDRNAYGNALGKFLSRKTDRKNPAKIQAALDKVAAMKSNPADPRSPTFGELISQGKLPGGEPK
jgi:hypothetical protein